MTEMTAATQPALVGPFTCPIDGEVHRSYAAWTRNDAHAHDVLSARHAASVTPADVAGQTVSVDAPSHGNGPARSHAEPVGPPTEKAADLLRALLRGVAFAATQTPTFDHAGLSPQELADAVERTVASEFARFGLDRVRCSKTLDDLKAANARPLWRPIVAANFTGQPTAVVPAPVAPVRANRYAGKCVDCGGHVEAEAGRLDKAAGAWVVRHLDGGCDAPAVAEADAPAWLARGATHVLGDRYLRVSYGQRSGLPYVNEWALTGTTREVVIEGVPTLVPAGAWEHAPAALKLINEGTVATPEQVAAFGHAYAACVFCGRDLDVAESITAGYGPTCAGKRGLPWG